MTKRIPDHLLIDVTESRRALDCCLDAYARGDDDEAYRTLCVAGLHVQSVMLQMGWRRPE